MKLILKLSATVLLLIAAFSALGYIFWYRPAFKSSGPSVKFTYKESTVNTITLQRLKVKTGAIKQYCKINHYNTHYCFMVDMQVASGKKRFFVYNLNTDSIEYTGLVTHGSGKNRFGGGIKFSNAVSSLCTSLGRYQIGNSYTGKFGLAFKLYGLDVSNSNAYSRFVVLHSHACVPAEETYPLPICESWGCPTVAPVFLAQLKKCIDEADKPILLEIYN